MNYTGRKVTHNNRIHTVKEAFIADGRLWFEFTDGLAAPADQCFAYTDRRTLHD